AEDHVDAAVVPAAGRRDQLPPVAVGAPAGAVGGQQVVVAAAPDRALAPGIAAVAPRRPPAAGKPRRLPVPRQPARARLGGVFGGQLAVLEAVGARVRRRAGVVGAVADLGDAGGVAGAVADVREADMVGGLRPADRVEVGGEDPVPAAGPHPGAVVDVVV